MKDNLHIKHVHALSTGTAQEILSKQLDLSQDDFNALLGQGSIWANDRRLTKNDILTAGTYVRVHSNPRRYNVEHIEWTKTIVFEDADFLVINKPSGVPVHATVDNKTENLLYQLQVALRHPVYVTQRLDAATSGLLVVAKTKWFQSQYNKMLQERSIQKSYFALTDNSVATGLHTHYMLESSRAPKQVFEQPQEGSAECLLKVVECIKLDEGYRSEIQLLTGRTHQIRAQLSFMNAPIKGDVLYGSRSSNPWATKDEVDNIALCSYRLEFKHPAKHGDAAQCLFLLSYPPSGNVKA